MNHPPRAAYTRAVLPSSSLPAIAAKPPWGAYVCLAASMALVGVYVGLSKLLVAVFPVFLLAWLRFGIAAAAMVHWLRRPADEPTLNAHDRRLVFLQSFFGNFLFSICMLYGVAATSAVAAGVVLAGIPASVALLSRVFLGERIDARMAIAIGLAVAGVALLAGSRDDASAATSAPWWGYALLVASMLCEATYVVIGKRLTSKLSARRISAMINLWGLALVTPLGIWQALRFDFSAVSLPIWAFLVFYAFAASIWSVWLWMRGLVRVPAARAGVFTVLLPIAATVVGVIGLNEHFGAGHAVAAALALSGLVIATWPARS
jgi:drug/metabolite transporter (DMT)-like permease